MLWLWIIVAVLLLLSLLAFIIPRIAYRSLFYRPKRSKKVPSFYMDSPHYKVSRAGMKTMDALPVEDCYITSRDGLRLHAYLYPGKDGIGNKFILGIHGYKSYARPEFGPYIDFYRSMGWSMLLPDDRAHGPSEGKYIGFGVLDRLDAVDWAKYLAKRFGKGTRILMHGVSMGSATVLASSGEKDLPVEVEGIIADCGYTSARDILTYQAGLMKAPKCLVRILERLSKKKAGYGFDEYTPLEQVKKARVPILFCQGGKDNMVPSEMAYRLYDACPTEKKLLFAEEAGHAETICFRKDEYEKAIDDMFHL